MAQTLRLDVEFDQDIDAATIGTGQGMTIVVGQNRLSMTSATLVSARVIRYQLGGMPEFTFDPQRVDYAPPAVNPPGPIRSVAGVAVGPFSIPWSV